MRCFRPERSTPSTAWISRAAAHRDAHGHPEAGATETGFAGEIHDQSQLYGLLDRVRDPGPELVSLQPQPAADPTTDDEETYRY
jgi:hypothetical protein